MIIYNLKYNGKGNIQYTEKMASDKRNVSKEPTDSFGKRLEEMIRELAEKFPNKSMDVKIISW